METLEDTAKACTGCGNSYPITREYWYWTGDKPHNRCRRCAIARSKQHQDRYRARNAELGDSVFDGTDKRCYACKSVYPRTHQHFAMQGACRDGLNSRCKACQTKTRKAWDRNPANRAKVRAQVELDFALRVGDIERGTVCDGCGATPDYALHGHHTSYDPADWLNVAWLCRKCHGKTRSAEAA